jgi:peroxiredoxin
MNSRALMLILALAAIGAGIFGWTRYRTHGTKPAVPDTPLIISSGEPERHKVTPAMLEAADSKANRQAPPIHMTSSDGTVCDLADMLKSGPVVLLFIKDGCPCSVSAETYFNAMHASYRGKIQFLGVIDGDAKTARRWGASNGVPFPIIPDPELALMHAYGATNSAFIALIALDGRIDQFWPGYSTSMLREFNARIAQLSGLPEEPLETGEAPEDLYSGCPF